MRKLAIVGALLLTGCAAQIMQSYVGKSLGDAVASYGPPSYAYDTGPNTRTFIWSMQKRTVLPGYATTNANVSWYGNMATGTATTTYTPPVAITGTCHYAIHAQRTRTDFDGPAAWTITGYNPPRVGCL